MGPTISGPRNAGRPNCRRSKKRLRCGVRPFIQASQLPIPSPHLPFLNNFHVQSFPSTCSVKIGLHKLHLCLFSSSETQHSGPSALLSYVSRLDDWILSYSLSDSLPKHMHRESFGREIKTCRLDCLSLNGRNSISYFLITPT